MDEELELPSEEKGGVKRGTAAKKRVEAFIPSEKTDSVLAALESINVQATSYESKGMGKGEKYLISYGKGGKTTKMPYSTRRTVVTIVDKNKVEEVVAAIKQSARTVVCSVII